MSELPLKDKLISKILTYYATVWRDKRENKIHESWLKNFRDADSDKENKMQINALYLLSKFMYFGNKELRELLKCVYRDLYKYPIIEKIRKENGDTLDEAFLNSEFDKELEKTRFLGVGNPSESGVHLLYYFRQENYLNKDLFINALDIFKSVQTSDKDEHGQERTYLKTEINSDEITRYIFIDDFCGSGSQAKSYSKNIVELLKTVKPDVEVNYLMLFGNEDGVNNVRKDTKFDRIEAIFTLDKTFECFSANSRYYGETIEEIEMEFTKDFCKTYGQKLYPAHPLGYKGNELLLGLFHNTPDNTLPVFWGDADWTPIFKRYPKIY